MPERWLPVVGFEGLYSVSDQGRVRSESRVVQRSNGRTQTVPECIKSTPPDGKGYPRVVLYRPDSRSGRTVTVHSLVMAAFVGPRPPALEVCHRNGNRMDARLANLRYDTRRENHREKVVHGTHNNANKTHCPSGHPYNDENTYVWTKPNGDRLRMCRACRQPGGRRATLTASPMDESTDAAAVG
ncbi:NUMOD4 motif-containing HNH endonuclease [Rhodococcus sp. NPDC079359]|uniref:NUMOD4 motif-containing HNH endonuclease n=1 Tax=Rhodococcus sp. NPDC079359 TaxID=3154961 RepID=UPI00344E3734